MKERCGHIQKLLADYGPSALKNDAAALDHVENCPLCFAFLEAISEIEENFEKPPIFDVSDEHLASILTIIKSGAVITTPEVTIFHEKTKQTDTESLSIIQTLRLFISAKKRIFIPAMALCMVLGMLGLMTEMRGIRNGIMGDSGPFKEGVGEEIIIENYFSPQSETSADGHSGAYQPSAPSKKVAKEALRYAEKRDKISEQGPILLGKDETRRQIAGKSVPIDSVKDISRQNDEWKGNREFEGKRGVVAGLATVGELPKPQSPKPGLAANLPATPAKEHAKMPAPAEPELIEEPHAKTGRSEYAFMDADNETEDRPVFKNERAAGEKKIREVKKPDELSDLKSRDESDQANSKQNRKNRTDIAENGMLAQLLAERSNTEPPAFKEAVGYWANTYVPGDPVFRRLETRLRNWDRGPLFAQAGETLALETASRKPYQPFDIPDNAAIGVFLSADRTAARDKSRVLIQVGLMGTSRYSGSRPAMNVGVVFDLTGDLPPEDAAGFRSLLSAFANSKDMADRFSLTVAGKPGGQLIQPGDFNYGHVTVAAKRLFEENSGEGQTLTLVQAVKTAIETVAGADDPTAPLGSSLVVVATSRPLGDVTRVLSQMAHESAVAGIPVSAVWIGPRTQADELDQIVLSGQGNRRRLETPAEAQTLVERELSAVGRVVARTLRLRIRLAPGVRLVDVIDSRRLDEIQAEHVREAEKSIDLRLARNLGIQSDRGEDEDGIQIVIPNFYAGDSHAILIDVVVPGPGPVADVTVRFKDLVKLRNGTARANLTLPRGDNEKGPLERNVMKNYLAFRLSETLGQAGDVLARGDFGMANRTVSHHLALLRALKTVFPDFARDPDFVADIGMLSEYASVLDARLDSNRQAYMADSLRLAGRLKISPKSVSE